MEQLDMFSLDKDVTSDYSALTNERTNERTKPKVAHCLFEQSGTFKNEFIKLGIPAYDYDIQNEFGQTDYVVDLFNEIEKAYEDKPSIFDKFTPDDVILAFFPCTRFENQIMLSFRGQAKQFKKWSATQIMSYDMELMQELCRNYLLVNKMFITCINRGLKLIMENPYSKEHFLVRYWCLPASIIDKDRRDNGDYYAKPTQYWFVNLEPANRILFEPISYNNIESKDTIRKLSKALYYDKLGDISQKTARSMIHPQYANRFIRQYIL